MNMVQGGGRLIGHAPAALHPVLGEADVLKPRQQHVERQLLPQGAASRRVGVVDGEAPAPLFARIRAKGALEIFHFAEFGGGEPGLAAIGHGDIAVAANGRHQMFQPAVIAGHGMGRRHGDQGPLAGADANVQGMAEGEIILRDDDQPVGPGSGDIAGVIGGTGIDDHRFEIPIGLPVQGIEQASEVLGFVVGADDQRGLYRGGDGVHDERESLDKANSGRRASSVSAEKRIAAHHRLDEGEVRR